MSEDGDLPTAAKVIFFPDWHVGSTVGLFFPWQWTGADAPINPTKITRIMWKVFEKGLDTIQAQRTKGDRLVIICNGDLIDGKHHDTNELLTGDENQQELIAISILEWALEKLEFDDTKDKLIFIKGTGVHVRNGQSTDRIAADFREIVYPLQKGTAKNNFMDAKLTHQRLEFSINGVRFDVAHHPEARPGRRAWTKDNALRAFLLSQYFDHLEEATLMPHYWIRAHAHVFTPAIIEKSRGTFRGVILPALQAKTDFVYRIAAGAKPMPGLYWVNVSADGTHAPDSVTVKIKQEKTAVF